MFFMRFGASFGDTLRALAGQGEALASALRHGGVARSAEWDDAQGRGDHA